MTKSRIDMIRRLGARLLSLFKVVTGQLNVARSLFKSTPVGTSIQLEYYCNARAIRFKLPLRDLLITYCNLEVAAFATGG